MRNAEFYINLINTNQERSRSEWEQIKIDVLGWLENCSQVEKEKFEDSGAGEMLQMILYSIACFNE